MNIYQRLIEVRKVVPYLQKEAEGQQYKYVSSSQVLASVRRKMDELSLLLIPKILSHQVATKEKPNNKGGTTSEYFTELEMEFTWVNAENPEETITVPWYGQGIDTAGEKGVGKALTYAEKYFILKQFNIATDKDDPDSFQEQTNAKMLNATKASETHKKTISKLIKQSGITKNEWQELLSQSEIDYTELTRDQAEKLIKALSTYKPKETAANE